MDSGTASASKQRTAPASRETLQPDESVVLAADRTGETGQDQYPQV